MDRTRRSAVAGIAVAALLLWTARGAADEPAGLGLDEAREKRLAEQAAAIRRLVETDGHDEAWPSTVERIEAARRLAAELLGLAEKTAPPPVDAPTLPDKAPVVVPPGATVEQVLAAWREQLALRVRSVHEVLTDPNTGTLPLWSEAIGVGWRDRKDLTKRARPLAAALREAQVFAMLLARPPRVIRVKPDAVLLEDALRSGHDKWLLYGPADTLGTDAGLRRRNQRVRNADSVMWSKDEFDGNFLYELTFTPNNAGPAPGVLFPICGRPVKPGTDLSVSAGETMDDYNLGVHAYHFSIHRGETGICNGRKVGTGLHLIGSRTPDPAGQAGKAHRVAVGKWDNVVFFLVDGALQHSYYDAGTFGPPLAGGHVGVRHWGGADAAYRDVRISRLVAVEEEPKLIEPKGKVLFEDAFKDLSNWRHEGGGTMTLGVDEPGAMRIECVGSAQGQAGSQAFCLTDFPDGVAIEYDLKVLTKNGLVITFVATKGSRGEDMFDPSQPARRGVFGDYVRNERLVSYHVSVSRYDDDGVHTGVSNWRRNPGLHLVGQGPDLCKEIGRWYRIRIVKDGGRCQLGVNGVLAHEFTDPGELPGPLPTGGKVGFRAIGSEVRALVRNFKVTALRPGE